MFISRIVPAYGNLVGIQVTIGRFIDGLCLMVDFYFFFQIMSKVLCLSPWPWPRPRPILLLKAKAKPRPLCAKAKAKTKTLKFKTKAKTTTFLSSRRLEAMAMSSRTQHCLRVCSPNFFQKCYVGSRTAWFQLIPTKIRWFLTELRQKTVRLESIFLPLKFFFWNSFPRISPW